MPDPNIPPVAIMPVSLRASRRNSLPVEMSAPRTQGYLDALEKTLPELPDAARQRLTARYGISAVDVDTLLGMDDVGGAGVRYFERVVDTAGAGAGSGKKAANWWVVEWRGCCAPRLIGMMLSQDCARATGSAGGERDGLDAGPPACGGSRPAHSDDRRKGLDR